MFLTSAAVAAGIVPAEPGFGKPTVHGGGARTSKSIGEVWSDGCRPSPALGAYQATTSPPGRRSGTEQRRLTLVVVEAARRRAAT